MGAADKKRVRVSGFITLAAEMCSRGMYMCIYLHVSIRLHMNLKANQVIDFAVFIPQDLAEGVRRLQPRPQDKQGLKFEVPLS